MTIKSWFRTTLFSSFSNLLSWQCSRNLHCARAQSVYVSNKSIQTLMDWVSHFHCRLITSFLRKLVSIVVWSRWCLLGYKFAATFDDVWFLAFYIMRVSILNIFEIVWCHLRDTNVQSVAMPSTSLVVHLFKMYVKASFKTLPAIASNALVWEKAFDHKSFLKMQRYYFLIKLWLFQAAPNYYAFLKDMHAFSPAPILLDLFLSRPANTDENQTTTSFKP